MGSLIFRFEDFGPNSVDIVALDGDLDAYSSPRLGQLLNELIERGSKHIVIDCTALKYVDSSGLGALVAAFKRISAESGVLDLAQINGDVRRVLQITGLDVLFRLYNSVDEARDAAVLQSA